METIVIDGGSMSTREAAHDHLALRLGLPDHYGRNLDALYDCLTDLGRPVRLEVFRREAMGETPFGRRLLRVLEDAAEECPWLELEID